METNELETDLLFKEMREEKMPATVAAKGTANAKFEMLPDGSYTGLVFVVADTVANEKSPNFGRKKYVIELTVSEGEFKGKMAYHHRVLLPHYLANKPAESEAEKLAEWRSAAKEYLKKTDEILANCGVDTTDTEPAEFTRKIAANNRRRPLVHFTMRNGNPYINRVVEKQTATASLGDLPLDGRMPDLPNGNDLPL